MPASAGRGRGRIAPGAHPGRRGPKSTASGRMNPVITIKGLSKTYATGVQALQPIDLEIERGEIFALLGPNGAGKTTLIGIVCGPSASSGTVTVDGHDILRDYRAARSQIGLVPQELTAGAFETVWATVCSPAACSASRAESGADRADPARPLLVGEARRQDRHPLRRHEAARADRQGAVARARDPVSRRAHRRRRRRAAPGHVGARAHAAGAAASPSSSPPTISRKPRRWPTGSASSSRAS